MTPYMLQLVAAMCICLAGSQVAVMAAEQPDPATAQEITPKEYEGIGTLIFRAVYPFRSPERKTQAAQTLLAMDREKLLGALAHQMNDREYDVWAIMFVRMYLPDKRLVPSLVGVLQEAKGERLMEAVKAAQAVPDPRLLAPIFDRALESDYEERIFLPAPIVGLEQIRKPLFGEAAKAIHVITGGAVGLKDVPYEKKLRSMKQEKLPQWRQWWQENKANWPAAPPLPEKPKEPASPGKKAPEKGASDETQAPPKTEPPKESPPPAAGQEVKSP